MALVIFSCDGSSRQSIRRETAHMVESSCCIFEWLLETASIFRTILLASRCVTRTPRRVGLWV